MWEGVPGGQKGHTRAQGIHKCVCACAQLRKCGFDEWTERGVENWLNGGSQRAVTSDRV